MIVRHKIKLKKILVNALFIEITSPLNYCLSHSHYNKTVIKKQGKTDYLLLAFIPIKYTVIGGFLFTDGNRQLPIELQRKIEIPLSNFQNPFVRASFDFKELGEFQKSSSRVSHPHALPN